MCLFFCLLLEYLLYHCVLAEYKCLFGNNIVFCVFLDFDSWILLKAFRSKVMVKNYFFAALALCAKGQMYKKV